jgi:heme-degrading monooxygenase HmoA
MLPLYARVLEIAFAPGHVKEIVAQFRATSVEIIARAPGAAAFLGLIDPSTGRSFTVSFWGTAEALEQSAVNPEIMANLATYAQWIAGPFARDATNVDAWSIQPLDPGDSWPDEFALVTTLHVNWDALEEVCRSLAERIEDDALAQRGYRGACLLSSRSSSRIVRVHLWDHREATIAAAERLVFRDNQVRSEGLLTAPPRYETHQVAGRWVAPDAPHSVL